MIRPPLWSVDAPLIPQLTGIERLRGKFVGLWNIVTGIRLVWNVRAQRFGKNIRLLFWHCGRRDIRNF
jgi:hypothetical protein